MYEWWQFQRYLICPKRLKIKVSIRLEHAEATRKEGKKARTCSVTRVRNEVPFVA